MSATLTRLHINDGSKQKNTEDSPIYGAFAFSNPIPKDGINFYILYTELAFEVPITFQKSDIIVTERQKENLIKQHERFSQMNGAPLNWIFYIRPKHLTEKEAAALNKITVGEGDKAYPTQFEHIYLVPV